MPRTSLCAVKRWAWLPPTLVGALLLGHGAWIPAKALLAQHLLTRAWAQTLAEGHGQRPWPWADHWPVGRLLSPQHGTDWVVLEGDSGHVLAFAPGHHPRSAMPGDGDVTVISGHRDTHFRFLEHVQVGDVIEIETTRGTFAYRVEDTRVVNAENVRLGVGLGRERLVLVTCYPFDGLRVGGPLRFVVTAAAAAKPG